MMCYLCGEEVEYVDSAWPAPELSERYHDFRYKEVGLCLPHAIERRKQNTARVRCLHIRLDMKGFCFTCGSDCRVLPDGWRYQKKGSA